MLVRKHTLLAVVPIVALIAAACGSSSKKPSTHASSKPPTTGASSTSSSSGNPTIKTATIKPYGQVLVASNGHALYVFAPDKAKKVTCTSACATIWPPVKLASGAKPTAGGQVKSSLLGSDPNPGGGRVVTYNGWPLYTYVTDTTAGVAHGQGIKSSGGYWHLMAPSGKPIMSKGSSGTSTSGGPYG
jgi:predicted lipoprotein with Yx(FWY)xxD motif